MNAKIASMVAALAFLFVSEVSAQDAAAKTDWREQYAYTLGVQAYVTAGGTVRLGHRSCRERNDADAKRVGNVAAQYLSNTVLLAAVLFVAGTSAKFDQNYEREGSFFFAVAAFLFAAVRMLMFPVT